MIATNIELKAQVKRERFKPFSSTDFSCHKTFASYLALTVLHKNTAKITWESKLRGESQIVIRIASPATANNCWLLPLEDNSGAGTEHRSALNKLTRQHASVVTLSSRLCYHHYRFSFLFLLSVPQTVSFTGQALSFFHMCSICPKDSKTDDCHHSISQHLCSDANKREKPLSSVSSLFQHSPTLSALSVVCMYFQVQDPVAQNSTRTPLAPLPTC